MIELIVVMAIVATLLSLVAPKYFSHVDRSKELVLKQNLKQVRDAIDKFSADKGAYPKSLDDLVESKYLQGRPFDPITDSFDTWTTIPPKTGGAGSIADIKSGSNGKASDGSAFADW